MSTTTSGDSRSVNGTSMPPAGTWTIDPGHAQIGFLGRHLKFTKVRGRFSDVSGSIEVADDPSNTTVEVTLGVASVETGNPDRDEHLRSSDLLDVQRHPTATFRGVVRSWTAGSGTVAGDLTIRGVSRSITFDVDYLGSVVDPWGGDRIVFSASTTIDRRDFGVTWNMALEAGGLLVSNEIKIEIELEATR